MIEAPPPPHEEMRAHWRLVAGGGVGLVFSIAPLLLYPFGVFIGPLAREFGWSRTELSGAIFVLQLSTAVSAPLYGYLIDRIGSRRVGLASTAVLGFLVMGLGLMTGPLWQLYAVFALIPLLAGGATPLPYARLVTERFDRNLGLALGLTLGGVGLGAMLLPPLAQLLIDRVEWRGAYFALGLSTLLIALPACAILLRNDTPAVVVRKPGLLSVSSRGFLTSRVFIALSMIFALIGGVTVALVAHFVPLLLARGFAPQDAAAVASLIGLAVIVGRIGIGLALDRFQGTAVLGAVLVALTAALGLLGWVEGAAVLYVVAVLIGLAVGAEVDVMAYLISRYFPGHVFGRLYGAMWGIFVIGSAFGPMLLGWLYRGDSYNAGIQVLLVASVAALAIAISLPKSKAPLFL